MSGHIKYFDSDGKNMSFKMEDDSKLVNIMIFGKKNFKNASNKYRTFIKMDEKDYPEVYLEECKYEIKKKKMNRYTDVELDLDVSDNCV